MKKDFIILLLTVMPFISGCSSTSYWVRDQYSKPGFALNTNDSIGVFQVLHTNTSVIDFATRNIEKVLASEGKLIVIPYDSLNLTLIDKGVFGQPILWSKDWLMKLSSTIDTKYIVRGVITDLSDNDIQYDKGSVVAIRFEIYDLKNGELVWQCNMSGVQYLPEGSFYYVYNTIYGELASLIDRIYKTELVNIIK